MHPLVTTLAATLIVSLISLIGITALAMNPARLRKLLLPLVGLAAGAMLGDAFIHLLPEAWETNSQYAGLLTLAGIALFFLVEKLLHWHHHGEAEEMETKHKPKSFGYLILAGDTIHNLIDGLLIGASFQVDPLVGIATTMAIVLHEIPQEFGDFAALVHSGFAPRKALIYNLISACTAVVGGMLSFVVTKFAHSGINFLLPIAAGGFLYIALADLVPELQGEKRGKQSLVQLASVGLGIGLMWFLTIIE